MHSQLGDQVSRDPQSSPPPHFHPSSAVVAARQEDSSSGSSSPSNPPKEAGRWRSRLIQIRHSLFDQSPDSVGAAVRARMPSFHTPDHVHLNGVGGGGGGGGGPGRRFSHLKSNESSVQLMAEASAENAAAAAAAGNGSAPYSPTTSVDDDAMAPLNVGEGEDDGERGATRTVVVMPTKASTMCNPSCWQRRTLLEKTLTLTLGACLLLLLIAGALICGRGDSLQNDHPDGVCSTVGCVQAAANLLQAIDHSVKPCDNFYQYACGRWNNDHPIPDDMAAYGTFAFVRERVRQQIRVLLQTSDGNEKSKAINQTRIAYRACMNTRRLRQLNSTFMHAAYRDLAYWPMIHGEHGVDTTEGGWRRDKFDLSTLLTTMRKQFGFEVFFSAYVYADSKNTSRSLLHIDQGSLGLGRKSRDYYLNDTMFGRHMRAYLHYMGRTVVTLASDYPDQVKQNRTDIQQSLKETLSFEKRLAKIMIEETERRNHSRLYNKRRVSDLYQLVPGIRWIEYFEAIMPPEMQNYVSMDTLIIIQEEDYLRNVSKLLEETDNRLLTDYVIRRFTQGWVKLLDSRFEDIKQEFLRIMTGQQQKPPRWKECTPAPVHYLPLAMGSLYVKTHFDANDKNEALQMIDNLMSSFTDIVMELDWMDEGTKPVAIAKARAMINQIGYPDFIRNATRLDAYYKGLDIEPEDEYFNLVKKVVQWTQYKELRNLIKPFDKKEFEVSPAIVNAFYSPERNAITFPAGILQPPFFSGAYPKSINYGAIGAVIGHEITHGFDDQGSQYDQGGNLQNWWSDEAYDRFNERKRCMVLQYSSYRVPFTDLNVNGELTQGENIADNGGVKEAYRAYRMFIKKRGSEEQRLPGLVNFTNDQLFFLSYAHFWCGQKKTAAAVQQVLTDEHSPEVFRVIGVLSNLDEFSKAFNCPVGSTLNPAKSNRTKCQVW